MSRLGGILLEPEIRKVQYRFIDIPADKGAMIP
jgi:hypothetical protein